MNEDAFQMRSLSVYKAGAVRCAFGANAGDPIGVGADLVLDDIYVLAKDAQQSRLSVTLSQSGLIRIANDSSTGTSGHRVYLDCLISLMSMGGQMHDILVMVEVDPSHHAVGVFLLPLADLQPKAEHVLMRIDRQAAAKRFAQLACVSFARGTRITLAGGVQCKIEELEPGDAVLTRDDGLQPLRWVGWHAERAVGHFAPIRIAAGALSNTDDLVVSPNHRFFVYQRKDVVGAGQRALLVRAADLVDGQQVMRLNGGFVDYFQLLFDRHQIIYAEGIAAETLLLDNQTRMVLPTGAPILAAHRPAQGRECDLTGEMNAAKALRRASLT